MIHPQDAPWRSSRSSPKSTPPTNDSTAAAANMSSPTWMSVPHVTRRSRTSSGIGVSAAFAASARSIVDIDLGSLERATQRSAEGGLLDVREQRCDSIDPDRRDRRADCALDPDAVAVVARSCARSVSPLVAVGRDRASPEIDERDGTVGDAQRRRGDLAVRDMCLAQLLDGLPAPPGEARRRPRRRRATRRAGRAPGARAASRRPRVMPAVRTSDVGTPCVCRQGASEAPRARRDTTA